MSSFDVIFLIFIFQLCTQSVIGGAAARKNYLPLVKNYFRCSKRNLSASPWNLRGIVDTYSRQMTRACPTVLRRISVTLADAASSICLTSFINAIEI